MKFIFILLLSLSVYSGPKKMNDIQLNTTDGKKITLDSYKEKTVLIVNIATRCGYTGQLADLETIFAKYKSKGLVVIGLPSNDFGSQTPEDDKNIEKFCRLKYGTSFPILKKSKVTGPEKHPLIKELLAKTNGAEISWNFEKFLINKDGSVTRFLSGVSPTSKTFTDYLAKSL
jgi:glutathione peroxidase